MSREFLVQLARHTPLLPGAGAVTFIDVDSLLRRVYGKKKQGVGFGHAKVGGYKVLPSGYNPLVATISTPDAAPLIAATQLRAGNASSARGASFIGRGGHRHHKGGPGRKARGRDRRARGAGRLSILFAEGHPRLPAGPGHGSRSRSGSIRKSAHASRQSPPMRRSRSPTRTRSGTTDSDASCRGPRSPRSPTPRSRTLRTLSPPG